MNKKKDARNGTQSDKPLQAAKLLGAARLRKFAHELAKRSKGGRLGEGELLNLLAGKLFGHGEWRALLTALAEEPTCDRCGTRLDADGYCGDGSCPYSDWPQHVPYEEMCESSTSELEDRFGVIKRCQQPTPHNLEHEHGDEHPIYDREAWQQEASEGNTRLGYWEWLAHVIESNRDDRGHAPVMARARDLDGLPVEQVKTPASLAGAQELCRCCHRPIPGSETIWLRQDSADLAVCSGCVTGSQAAEGGALAIDELISAVRESLAESDGEHLCSVASRVLGGEVAYRGDDRFERDGRECDFDALLTEICDTLGEHLDGEWIAGEAGRVLARSVRYLGDSLFEMTC